MCILYVAESPKVQAGRVLRNAPASAIWFIGNFTRLLNTWTVYRFFPLNQVEFRRFCLEFLQRMERPDFHGKIGAVAGKLGGCN